MNPWSFDAGDIDPSEISQHFIVRNDPIETFLTTSKHERKLILLGPKGSGKTLLLRYKAFLYWKKLALDEQRIKVEHSGELVESLDFDLKTLSYDDLKLLSKNHYWIRIWRFAIALIIVRKSNIDPLFDTSQLDTQFPKHFNLSQIVTKVLNNTDFYLTSDFFSVNNELVAALGILKNSFALFIDRLDQALNLILQQEEYKYLEDENSNNVAYLVWKNAQFSLMEVIYNINSSTNSHIKVFATIRIEALTSTSDQILRQNILNYCCSLDYSYKELRQIFINNIRNVPNSEYSLTNGKNLILRYFGFEDMPHVTAKDNRNIPLVEDVFGFIFRHTFGRPREIVFLGKVLYSDVISKHGYKEMPLMDKIESVRRIVNDESHFNILDHYLSQIVPAFKEEYLKKFGKTIQSNVLEKDLLHRLEPEIYNYLYRIGLIGYPVNGKQVFLPAAKHIYKVKETIPFTDYYIVHPTIDRKLQQYKKFQEFYNHHNIVGQGYDFYPPPLDFSDLWNDIDLSYVLPKYISGKSGKLTDKLETIKFPLTQLYEGFFINGKGLKSLIKFKRTEFEKIFKLLSTVANLLFLHKIQAKFNVVIESWQEELKLDLKQLLFAVEYSTIIDNDDEENLIRFGERLTGRLLVSGLIVYLGLSNQVIHTMLKSLDLTFDLKGPIVSAETAQRYLKRAFFIKGLKMGVDIWLDERKKIFDGLSLFEKHHLSRWWVYHKNHEFLIRQDLTAEHKKYIDETFLSDNIL